MQDICRTKPYESFGDDNWYSTKAFCANCGAENLAYLRKGIPLSGHSVDCDNCGCAIPLKATPLKGLI